jgi:hypothetical protein
VRAREPNIARQKFYDDLASADIGVKMWKYRTRVIT